MLHYRLSHYDIKVIFIMHVKTLIRQIKMQTTTFNVKRAMLEHIRAKTVHGISLPQIYLLCKIRH